jgi:hypothetical protein
MRYHSGGGTALTLAGCFGMLAVGVVFPEPARAEDVCSKLPSHLLTLETRKAEYRPYEKEDDGAPRYVGDQFRYTRFSHDGGKFVLASGHLLQASTRGQSVAEDVDLVLASAPFFDQAEWLGGHRLWDMDLNAADQKLVRLVSSVTFFLADSEKANRALTSRTVAQNLGRWGVRGSNVADWYDCQDCADPAASPRRWSQDLRSTRLAVLDGRLFLVTTRPRTVAVEMNFDRSLAVYTQCNDAVGREIDMNSDQSFEKLSKSNPITIGG